MLSCYPRVEPWSWKDFFWYCPYVIDILCSLTAIIIQSADFQMAESDLNLVSPKGGSKSCFHAFFLHKSCTDIAWNLCSRQVYRITLDTRLMYHAITQFFIQFPFSCSEICPITPSRFPLEGPYKNSVKRNVWLFIGIIIVMKWLWMAMNSCQAINGHHLVDSSGLITIHSCFKTITPAWGRHGLKWIPKFLSLLFSGQNSKKQPL